MTLLHIDTSILGAGSVSRELSALIIAKLTAGRTDTVIYRDLAAEDLSHMTAASLPGAHPMSAAAGPLDGSAKAARETSDRVLDEFLAADTVVIGTPMYNFTVPSQLKAWIDRIIVPGKTFRYGASGPEGLAGDKRVIVALARGGFYGRETAQTSVEHAESYLRTVFGFVGIQKPEFVLAEGLATGEHNKLSALSAAREAVAQLAA